MRFLIFIGLILINSCKSQQTINKIYDNNLSSKIIKQFNEKYKLNLKDSVYVLFFQESPEVNSVSNGETTTQKHSGFTVTIYNFKTKEQVYQFTNEFNVYQANEFKYYIFEKKSSKTFLKNLKKNPVKTIVQFSDDSYDPASWVLNFDSNGKLEKCYPINCN